MKRMHGGLIDLVPRARASESAQKFEIDDTGGHHVPIAHLEVELP